MAIVTDGTANRSWWVYENWAHRYVKIHRADCPHCNDGQGRKGNSARQSGQWIGPLTEDDAWAQAGKLNYRNVEICYYCRKYANRVAQGNPIRIKTRSPMDVPRVLDRALRIGEAVIRILEFIGRFL